ncbi:MBL fold metallo-hydrolase [Curvibacter sp. APW13]|uniref:MBL fold metallo-hydrolase n=1 Tax=Curvibacter sp. APW13 TaxID=3077236 RepID=UPI0028DF10A5|nr:MBL fold metallo-hydrolase [Curvibacter sp. APW13]MDT8992012.1 MBL fold metallo-hydrolase [Curvibacter sp. APW13]
MKRWLVVMAAWVVLRAGAQEPRVGLSIVQTGQAQAVEATLVPGGSVLRTRAANFSAFLVKHGSRYMLFDTGLGRGIDAQHRQDMPVWARLAFGYEQPIRPAVDQLHKAGIANLERVVLSHSHWDHASGIPDFSGVRVAVAQEEMQRITQARAGVGTAWPSQVGASSIAWEPLVFTDKPYRGYPRSLDFFGDGAVVLVPMPGHTPGSVGLFVTVDSGRRYFLIGDVAWTREALEQAAPKFWLASKLVDGDGPATQQSLEQVQQLMRTEPELQVIPAHDSVVQDVLGYFPRWVP